MNKTRKKYNDTAKTLFCAFLSVLTAGWISCSEQRAADGTPEGMPSIFPDYTEVTIPPNIAPLHFKWADSCRFEQSFALFEIDGKQTEVKGRKGQFAISVSSWKKLMAEAGGKTLYVTLSGKCNGEWHRYSTFPIYIAAEPIDSYLAYRLIEPGYEIWHEMGIYQRCLENYEETAIVTNRQMEYNCMNCHSFCMQQPDRMLLHIRDKFACTLLINDGQVEKLNTKTDRTLSPLVYPSWHPSGKYVAFSVNNTNQMFHTSDRNRVEVFDFASDVVVYDVEKHEIITAPPLFSKAAFETFPTFSPDGKTLYFCSSDTVPMPYAYNKVRYSLCSITFDADRRRFGATVDTLFKAGADTKSVSFPRISPDGKFLMFTLSGYGNFSIWHKDADLYMLSLDDHSIRPLDALNSEDVESYHSWSSNSRWVVFSSRRIDGLYTRPYIAYIHPDGQPSKPFLLPQKDVDFYHRFMKSYNIPELITGKVRQKGYTLSRTAIHEQGEQVTFFKR